MNINRNVDVIATNRYSSGNVKSAIIKKVSNGCKAKLNVRRINHLKRRYDIFDFSDNLVTLNM